LGIKRLDRQPPVVDLLSSIRICLSLLVQIYTRGVGVRRRHRGD